MQVAHNDTYGGELLSRRVEREAGEEITGDRAKVLPGRINNHTPEEAQEFNRLALLADDWAAVASITYSPLRKLEKLSRDESVAAEVRAAAKVEAARVREASAPLWAKYDECREAMWNVGKQETRS